MLLVLDQMFECILFVVNDQALDGDFWHRACSQRKATLPLENTRSQFRQIKATEVAELLESLLLQGTVGQNVLVGDDNG